VVRLREKGKGSVRREAETSKQLETGRGSAHQARETSGNQAKRVPSVFFFF
jgi:hypothetical protein